MATTGFWPVKSNLAHSVQYVVNLEKTGQFLNSSLQNAMLYIGASEKTEYQMFVSATNCTKQLAYDQMMDTKRRFGKLGGNLAYHGFQSFRTGEVTPEEAHNIGIETARKMWGDDYEVVVATHLNTDNIHNHVLVNSVSFRTGKKFENHVSDHRRFRDISDEVCRSRNLSVLEGADFYKKGNKRYWADHSKKESHKQILRRDINEALSHTKSWRDFDTYMARLGYRYARSLDYSHPSFIADGWERPVRLSSLGDGYSVEDIEQRLEQNWQGDTFIRTTFPVQNTPLFMLEIRVRKMQYLSGIQATFYLMTELLKLITGNRDVDNTRVQPLSPALRAEVNRMDQYQEQYWVLRRYDIQIAEELPEAAEVIKEEIAKLKDTRQKCYNRCRHPKSEEVKQENLAAAREITEQITQFREDLRNIEKIAKAYPEIQKLLEQERQQEQQLQARKQRNEKER